MMDCLKSFFYYFNAIFDLIYFGFWPSLVLMSFFLVTGNVLYYLFALVIKAEENPRERKKERKQFWWALLGQLAFVSMGLLMIYIEKGITLSTVYFMFLLYYCAAAFFIFTFSLAIVDWHKERRNKQH